MKTFGKFPAGNTPKYILALCVAATGIVYMTTDQKNQDMADAAFYAESAKIPERAVYLGSKMGGYFVTLERQDISLEDGRTMPAFSMELYHAWANRRDYGAERVGELAFKGQAIYVPSAKMLEDAGGTKIDPPNIAHILVNDGRWVDGGTLHIRMKPPADDPDGNYIAQIVPM